MSTFDLKFFREKKLGWTQAQLAERMGTTQDQISRLESGATSMSVDFFTNLCDVAGMLPNDVLKFKLVQPEVFQVADVYSALAVRINTLEKYIRTHRVEFETENFTQAELKCIDELTRLIRAYDSKPLVAFMGPSDAGKSRMINALTGLDRLLKSEWTPTTAVTVYVKHIDSKPTWMDGSVMVFKSESDETGWNFHKSYDEEYCRQHMLASGSLDVLEQYSNRGAKHYVREVDSAVVYIDAPILKACDIVDLPGFGTESVNETIHSQRAKDLADIIVFLCQSNAFFNDHNHVLFLKEVIHHLNPVHLTANAPVLSNLFVVASQASIVGEQNIETVLNRGRSAIKEQISEDLISQHFHLSKAEFHSALDGRFFSYAMESSKLREDFEVEIKMVLETVLPPIRISQLDDAVTEMKDKYKGYFDQMVQYYETVIESVESAKAEVKELERNQHVRINSIQTAKNEVFRDIENHLKRNRTQLREWETTQITIETVKGIIKRKNYDRKKAQKYLAGNVSDMYYAKLQEVLQESTIQFNQVVSRFFEETEHTLVQTSRYDSTSVTAPFDFKGAIAGGLVGVTVLGGLGLWAGTLGNLGGYILVTQGVGLLSALGISVGGGAAAVSAVAAIGGPVTIGIAIALGTFLVVKGIFGDTWKERLAKKLIESIKREQLLDKYIESAEQYWADTRSGIDVLVTALINSYEEYVKNRREVANADDPELVSENEERAKRLRDFFDFLPW